MKNLSCRYSTLPDKTEQNLWPAREILCQRKLTFRLECKVPNQSNLLKV